MPLVAPLLGARAVLPSACSSVWFDTMSVYMNEDCSRSRYLTASYVRVFVATCSVIKREMPCVYAISTALTLVHHCLSLIPDLVIWGIVEILRNQTYMLRPAQYVRLVRECDCDLNQYMSDKLTQTEWATDKNKDLEVRVRRKKTISKRFRDRLSLVTHFTTSKTHLSPLYCKYIRYQMTARHTVISWDDVWIV